MQVGNKVLGVRLAFHSTDQAHELGLEVLDVSGRVYKYQRAGAAIALGDVLKVDVAEGINDADPTLLADAIVCGCWPNESVDGVARTAILDNEFFFMLVEGDASVKSAATVVAGAAAVTIATQGTVDDTAATAANALSAGAGRGMVFATVAAGGFARVLFT